MAAKQVVKKDVQGKWRMTTEAKAEFALRRVEINNDLQGMPFEEWRQKYNPSRVSGPGRPRRRQ